MKKCNECNVEMIDGKLEGQHPFEIGVDGRTDMFVQIQTGEKKKFLGFEYDGTVRKPIKTRICPNCGKVELYVEYNQE